MDIARETDLINKFLAGPFAPRFRTINRRWWVLAEQGWTQRMAAEQLQHAIMDTASNLWELSDWKTFRQAGMAHQQRRIISMLSGRLDTNHLPGPGNPLWPILDREPSS